MTRFNIEKLYDLHAVGKRIRSIRGDYTLEEFGFLANRTSKAAVFNWESGKSLPNKERLKIIAVLGRTTTEWILFGDLPNFIQTLFSVTSEPYPKIKAQYTALGHRKVFEWYESASESAQKEVINKTVAQAQQNNWGYAEVAHILDLFVMTANSVLKQNQLIENLPPTFKELLFAIKEQNLSNDEIDTLVDSLRDYLKA